jgi:probable selenium-dependent hydroxylase accessory protein YqeC
MPMQQLSTFLNIQPSQCVSIMGAGGKSTLMNRLADELIVLGRTVVLSSTTNYHRPRTLQPDQILLTGDAPDWPDRLGVLGQRWNRLLVLHHDLGDAMVKGIDIATVRIIHDRIPDAIVIVKTDGARKRWFKAPNRSEPVIPPWSQLSITVVNWEILGQSLTEALVHRPERVAELTGLTLGDPITPQVVGTVLTHPDTYAAKIPSGARRAIYISHVRTAMDVEQAKRIAVWLDRSAIDDVMAGDTPSGTFYEILRSELAGEHEARLTASEGANPRPYCGSGAKSGDSIR